MTPDYLPADSAPAREDVDRMAGMVVLEFGTDWCGFCQAAQPKIIALLSRAPGVRHVKVEDGRGRKLGRSFGVKLWPTLVFLRDGVIVRQLPRPSDTELEEAFAALTATSSA